MTENTNKKGLQTVVAAVGGLVVGAGLAIAGVLALKDKKTKAKVDGVLKDLKSKAEDVSKKIEDTAKTTKKELEKMAK